MLRLRGGIPTTYLALNKPWLWSLGIGTVLDIGANSGQFAATIHAMLPKAQLYSFEPLPDCFAQLQTNMKGVSNFTAFNIALGDQVGTLQFERNAFSPSSSFLRMTKVHKTTFPFTRNSHTVDVKIDCLDNIAATLDICGELMVKIDVQGYEDRVIRGGQKTIERARLIIAETSFETLYDGQPLFDDIYRTLVDRGFVYAGMLDQLNSPRDGRALQADGIFIRRP